MTDKQIIKLKPTDDLNEKIIKEKGNTECIFYADDICRNGDKTRDCVNCARVEYHYLYSLNWDNQEKLQKIIKHKEQECEELKKEFKLLEQLKDEDSLRVAELSTENADLTKQLNQLKVENDELERQLESTKGLVTVGNKQLEQTLKENEELEENLSDLKKDLKIQNDKISELELDLQNANSTIENLDLMRVGEYNALVDDYEKLKQTLTEIKEIANKTLWTYPNLDDVTKYNMFDKILQKINEVDNDKN